MALWLCLRFDRLPLHALSRDEAQPVVVQAKQRVVACNDSAAEYGVQPGLRTGTAKALLGEQSCRWLEQNPAAEQTVLTDLLSWGYGFTPAVETWADNCLLLEIGGCLKLFAGHQALIQRALTELAQRGFSALPGLGESRRSAWLLSHAPSPQALAIHQPLDARLAGLPLSLLTAFPKDVERLNRAGIHHVTELLKLPAPARSRRCSDDLRRWLDQLTGLTKEVSSHYQPPKRFYDALWFGFEVRQQDELIPAMRELLGKFSAFCRQTQRQTQVLRWRLLKLQGATTDFEVRGSGGGLDWQHWLELSTLRLNTLQIGRDTEGIALQVEQLSPANRQTDDLFADPRHKEPRQALVDRLRSRLGLEAIQHIGARCEHVPEHCLLIAAETPQVAAAAAAQRPFWLLPQPQPIQSRDNRLFCNGLLQLVYGPERIEDSWWQRPISRDYYIAQREDGDPVWVFQDRHSKRWYLHGLFE